MIRVQFTFYQKVRNSGLFSKKLKNYDVKYFEITYEGVMPPEKRLPP